MILLYWITRSRELLFSIMRNIFFVVHIILENQHNQRKQNCSAQCIPVTFEFYRISPHCTMQTSSFINKWKYKRCNDVCFHLQVWSSWRSDVHGYHPPESAPFRNEVYQLHGRHVPSRAEDHTWRRCTGQYVVAWVTDRLLCPCI